MVLLIGGVVNVCFVVVYVVVDLMKIKLGIVNVSLLFMFIYE